MALTYDQSATLMNDASFRGRIKVACMKYANYIYDEASNTPAHSTRIKWSQRAMLMPDAAAAEVAPTVVMDGQVQADGATISDVALQSSVETAINKLL